MLGACSVRCLARRGAVVDFVVEQINLNLIGFELACLTRYCVGVWCFYKKYQTENELSKSFVGLLWF